MENEREKYAANMVYNICKSAVWIVFWLVVAHSCSPKPAVVVNICDQAGCVKVEGK